MTELPTEPENSSNQLFQADPGTLYLVGTPIGNLGDLTPRAADVLSAVSLVAAEDTRRTLRLLNHLGLRKHLESYHEHNWQSKGAVLLAQLQAGRSIALVSDAGMPCISDPGSDLVRLCVEQAIPVIVIPGPCAAIAALAGSGLLTDRFVFEGFIPASGKSRKERLALIATELRTIVLYEAPHRLKRTLADLAAQGLAGRQLILARELTKRHEEFLRITLAEAIAKYDQLEPRGEYVLVLEGLEAFHKRSPMAESAEGAGTASPDRSAEDLLRSLLDQGFSIKDAVRECQAKTGRKKNDIYQLALSIQQQPDSPDPK